MTTIFNNFEIINYVITKVCLSKQNYKHSLKTIDIQIKNLTKTFHNNKITVI